MIKYRKNEKWGSVTISTEQLDNIDQQIEHKLKTIKIDPDECIDIVDINTNIPNNTICYIIVFYAITKV